MADWRTAGLCDDLIALEPWNAETRDESFRDPELGRYFGSAIGSEPPVVDSDVPNLGIVVRATDRIVGRIWCRPGARPPEIGYYLRRDAWGNGYATRALVLATSWLLGDGGFDEVVLRAHPENARSQAVAQRAGYVRTGIVEDYAEFKDGTRTAVGFACTSISAPRL
jgi:RimJ/RimL family protein N-acetyltransferase